MIVSIEPGDSHGMWVTWNLMAGEGDVSARAIATKSVIKEWALVLAATFPRLQYEDNAHIVMLREANDDARHVYTFVDTAGYGGLDSRIRQVWDKSVSTVAGSERESLAAMDEWERRMDAGEKMKLDSRPRYADAPECAVKGGYEYSADDWAYATPPGRSHMWCRDETFIYDTSRKVHVVQGWWRDKGKNPIGSIASWGLSAKRNLDVRLFESSARSYGADNVPDGAQWQARFRVDGFHNAFQWLVGAQEGS